MKVVFAGPSLYGAQVAADDIVLRAPAAQGDIGAAIASGATAIGLIDGVFGSVASVWHKEILAALSAGIPVLGASSMGALRAAECAEFGMIPIGIIAEAYLSGALDDDAAVALTFAPQEFDWMPLSEPLVDVWPTLGRMLAAGVISDAERMALKAAAEALHFSERTPETIIGAAGLARESGVLVAQYEQLRYSQKQADAIELIKVIGQPLARSSNGLWDFSQSPMWRRFMSATHA